MGKKCIPGLFCIENFTLFLIIFFLNVVFVFFYPFKFSNLGVTNRNNFRSEKVDVGRCNGGDPLKDPYVPPMKCDGGNLTNGIPINIQTQSTSKEYTQIGILSSTQKVVLPLMGRRTIISRDKWQYYTMSGGGPGGNLQTKLPIKVKGKNATSENGVDEIYTNDEVYVEGLKEIFIATIYENGLFSYIPNNI
jgi:hypothetical protein